MLFQATETLRLFVAIVKTNEYAYFHILSFSIFFVFVFIYLFVLPLEYAAYFLNIYSVSPEDILGYI